jgi:hypothetical protein
MLANSLLAASGPVPFSWILLSSIPTSIPTRGEALRTFSHFHVVISSISLSLFVSPTGDSSVSLPVQVGSRCGGIGSCKCGVILRFSPLEIMVNRALNQRAEKKTPKKSVLIE